MEEAALLERLRQGDSESLGELFLLYRDRLKLTIRCQMDRRLLRRMDVEDVLQDAWVSAQQRLNHYLSRTDMSCFVWLRMIVSQTIVDLHRRHLRAARRSLSREQVAGYSSTGGGLHQLAGRFSSPSNATLQAELSAQIHLAVAELKQGDRELLEMRHLELLSVQEIAEVFGVGTKTASARYVRALRRLRAILSTFPGFDNDAA